MSSLFVLLVLSDSAISLEHFKLFDPESGEILLFLLALTPKSLEVYKVHKASFELIRFFPTNAKFFIITGHTGTLC